PRAGWLTKESSVHRGQVGQPNPEPVRRTAPPVTMMAMLTTTDATARWRTPVRVGLGSCTSTRVRTPASSPVGGRLTAVRDHADDGRRLPGLTGGARQVEAPRAWRVPGRPSAREVTSA